MLLCIVRFFHSLSAFFSHGIDSQASNFESLINPHLRKEDRYTRIKNLIMLLKKPPEEIKHSKLSTSDKATSKNDTLEDESSVSSHHWDHRSRFQLHAQAKTKSWGPCREIVLEIGQFSY